MEKIDAIGAIDTIGKIDTIDSIGKIVRPVKKAASETYKRSRRPQLI